MTERKIQEAVQGFRTTDGAGVNLVRVLNRKTVESYDPLLMLDSFDSQDPNDYIKGFPQHPHRGIETITFLEHGSIAHKDSLGNEGTIQAGEVQWMTAGSGILHEEMPQAAERMLGVQVWLNLPRSEKMCQPFYHALTPETIPQVEVEGGMLSVISGSYKGVEGFQAPHHPLTFYSLKLSARQEMIFDTPANEAVMLFLLEGKAKIAGEDVAEKTCVRTTAGDKVTIKSLDSPLQLLYFSAPRLDEPIVWSGPIVMNTGYEVQRAWLDLREDKFIRDQAEGSV